MKLNRRIKMLCRKCNLWVHNAYGVRTTWTIFLFHHCLYVSMSKTRTKRNLCPECLLFSGHLRIVYEISLVCHISYCYSNKREVGVSLVKINAGFFPVGNMTSLINLKKAGDRNSELFVVLFSPLFNINVSCSVWPFSNIEEKIWEVHYFIT